MYLKADLYNKRDEIEVVGTTAAGSSCTYPRVLNSHEISVNNNKSLNVRVVCEYEVSIDIVVYPYKTVIDMLEIQLTKSAGSESFKFSGSTEYTL